MQYITSRLTYQKVSKIPKKDKNLVSHVVLMVPMFELVGTVCREESIVKD